MRQSEWLTDKEKSNESNKKCSFITPVTPIHPEVTQNNILVNASPSVEYYTEAEEEGEDEQEESTEAPGTEAKVS